MFHAYSGIFNLPKNYHPQETFKSLCYMLLKIWNMSMYNIMNITVYDSACIWVYLWNAKLWFTPKAKLEMHIRNAHIKSVNFWVTMVVFNQDLLRKVEFYEYKMYLDVEIVAPFMLLPNSKFNNLSEYCVRRHFLIPSLFHIFNFIYIWWISVLCRNVGLMIIKSANEKMNTEKIKKKGREAWYVNFKLRFPDL